MRLSTLLAGMVTGASLTLGLMAPGHALTLGQIAQRAAQNTQIGPFGAIEMVAHNASNRVAQWNRALSAMREQSPQFAACLQDSEKCQGAAMSAWRDMMFTLQNADKVTQVRMVNTFFNRWQYREDRDVYGKSDVWATPAEFMANSGDCEDYAIAKYFTLSALGFTDRQLRIMAVINNTSGAGHSVLAANVEGTIYVLDNLSNTVLRDTDYAQNYTPRFAVNASGIWAYSTNPNHSNMLVLASAD